MWRLSKMHNKKQSFVTCCIISGWLGVSEADNFILLLMPSLDYSPSYYIIVNHHTAPTLNKISTARAHEAAAAPPAKLQLQQALVV